MILPLLITGFGRPSTCKFARPQSQGLLGLLCLTLTCLQLWFAWFSCNSNRLGTGDHVAINNSLLLKEAEEMQTWRWTKAVLGLTKRRNSIYITWSVAYTVNLDILWGCRTMKSELKCVTKQKMTASRSWPEEQEKVTMTIICLPVKNSAY